jgi:hypothetical protein
MSEVAGQSTAEKHETGSMDEAPLDGNLDDIFDDDAGYGGGGDDTSNLMGGFENAFDEIPPVTKKWLVKQASAAVPAPVTSGGSKGRGSKSSLPPPPTTEVEEDGWQDDVTDIPHRRELIRQM